MFLYSYNQPTELFMAPNVTHLSICELYDIVEAIQEDDPEFEVNEDTLKQDIHKWYTGENYCAPDEDETVYIIKECDAVHTVDDTGCMCLQEYSWVVEGRDLINPNTCCKHCLDTWQAGAPKYYY